MRISRVAVRPRISFAFAVSWTPGSCTTTRSPPCCWMIGSATPSSFTRLRSVVMFCWSAKSAVRRCASGLSEPTMRDSPESSKGFSSRCGVAETHHEVLAVAADPGVLDALLAQPAADVVGEGVDAFLNGAFHVDLQQ